MKNTSMLIKVTSVPRLLEINYRILHFCLPISFGKLIIALITLTMVFLSNDHAFSGPEAKKAISTKIFVMDEIRKKYPKLVQLIIKSESIDDKERQYWFDIIPSMTNKQINSLYGILETERRQLDELNLKYNNEITTLNDTYLRQAQLNPEFPTLRIETLSHLGVVWDVDQQGAFAITVGKDKTGRIWNLSEGKLHQTLRIPLADGREGMLYAAALHPTEPWAVVGGITKLGGAGGVATYVFHRDTGGMLATLKGFPLDASKVNFLRFIRGGTHLLVKAGKELSLWRTSDWSRISTLPGSVQSVLPLGKNSAEFIVATEKEVAHYELVGDAMQKQQAVPRERFSAGEFGWAVSPDRKQLLWAESDQPKVWLIDIDTLHRVREAFAVDFPGVREIPAMAWRRDGHIFISYSHPQSANSPLLSAHIGGKAEVIATLREPVIKMALLPDDSILAVTSEPLLAKIEAESTNWSIFSHRAGTYQDSEGAKESILRASDDGRKIEFGFDFHRRNPHTFNLLTRILKAGGDQTLNFPQRPDYPNRTIQLKGWKNHQKTSLKVNGQWKSLGNMENNSAAIAPDGKGFVVADNWTTRRYGQDGEYSWWNENEATVSETLITRNGKLVITVDGRGVVQWRNYMTGKLLLNLFIHSDGRRWVLWTPSGYYEASQGAEDLIGWHINRGKDQAADFFPASRFRDTYYRPDVIDRILDTLDEAEALKQADTAAGRKQTAQHIQDVLPPVVNVISPAGEMTVSTDTLTVRYRVRTPADAPVTAVRARVNGQAVELSKNASRLTVESTAGSAGELTLQIPIPKADSEVQLFAANKNGSSTPAVIRVKWTGTKEEFVVKPKLYVLAVGVSDYKDASLKLNYAAKDANDFVAAIKQQQGQLYREVVVKTLANNNASREAVLDGLEWLQKQVTQYDVGMLFLSGHGENIPSEKGPVYHYLPWDTDRERIKRTGVPFSDIKDTLANLSGKSVLFLDTCHSGNVMGGATKKGVTDKDTTRVVNELISAENGGVVLASSTGREYSLEKAEWGNGAFTKALIEGLSGKADSTKSKRITHKMLSFYVSERVKELTEGRQHPVSPDTQGVPDFPLALVK